MFQRFKRSNWFIPAVSGILILISLGLNHLFGAADFLLSKRWWIDAGSHAATDSEFFKFSDALLIVATLIAGYNIAVKAVRSLMVKFISIELLVSIAAVGATVIGNFWEAAAVTFLFAIGHALEAGTMNKTRGAISKLIEQAPEEAVVLRDDKPVTVAAHAVRLGETVVVKNGAKVPVDGVVISGSAAIDEASITGESIPAEKNVGDAVFAGTISRGGLIQVQTTGVGADTTLARIIHRVEEAQDAKAKTQTFIDKFSRWYTPAVLLIALGSWLLTGDIVLALTLLVIGCPGALVISIPVAIVSGIGRAARNGILIKGGEYLEAAAKISVVAVDKTGTLTEGEPQLTDVVVLAEQVSEKDVLRWAAVAEVGSEHPLAKPILDAAATAGVAPAGFADETTPVIGKGIAAFSGGERILVGNIALLEQFAVPVPENAVDAVMDLADSGKTAMIVAHEQRVLGVVAVADKIRVDAANMVQQLHSSGVKEVVMLTGDSAPVAKAVSEKVGIDTFHASLLPEDKLAAVAEMQKAGHTVAMVGDGVNDAPALASADIGVAMGATGSAVAIESADLALMSDNLLKLPEAIYLAKRTVRVMKQNIFIAIATVFALLLGVFAGEVSMAVGMLVHEGSVLLVILNAMRLLQNTPGKAVSQTTAHRKHEKEKDVGLVKSS